MADSIYRESVAYHEAGHIVVAAAQGLRLSRRGIHLDSDGRGMAYYKYRKTKRFGPPEINRESTIVATYAGLIAQKEFHPDCSIKGADTDGDSIGELLREMDAEDDSPFLHLASDAAKVELEKESERLLKIHWAAIVAVATALLGEPDTIRYSDEPEPYWSLLQYEKMLNGERIIEILKNFDIYASLWDHLRD